MPSRTPEVRTPAVRPRFKAPRPLMNLALALAATSLVPTAQAEVSWGGWINRDGPGGSGDWEDLAGHINNGDAPCTDPVDVQVRRRSDDVNFLETGEVPFLARPDYGFACTKDQQPDNACFDYEVRFGCLTNPRTLLPEAGFGRAMYFDGVDDRIVSYKVLSDAASDRTYSVRVMPTELREGVILTQGGADIMRMGTDGKISVALAGGGTLTSQAGLVAYDWNPVAVRYDLAADETAIFIDGELDSVAAGSPAAFDGELVLGYDAGDDHFMGLLDEVRVYDVARSAGAIRDDAHLAPSTAGLVLHYDFDEVDGAPDEDASSKSRLMDGDPVRVPVTDRILVSSHGSSAFDIPADVWDGGDYTWSGWMKPGNSHNGIVLQMSGTTVLYFKTDNKLYGWLTSQRLSSTALQWNTWQHVALTWDGASSTGRMYVNGSQVASDSGTSLRATGGVQRIGYDISTSRDWQFTGALNDVRIYDRALSEAEIAAEMVNARAVPQAGPVAQYRLDEGTGAVAIDERGLYDGTYIDSPSWQHLQGGEAPGLGIRQASINLSGVAGQLPGAGEGLTFELVSGVPFGDVLVDPDTGAFTYTPPPLSSGTETFTYRVSDGVDTSEPVTVSIASQQLVAEGTPITPVTMTTPPYVIATPLPLALDCTVEGGCAETSVGSDTYTIVKMNPTAQNPSVYDHEGDYDGLLTVEFEGSMLQLDYDGFLHMENGEIIEMQAVATFGQSDLPFMEGLTGGTVAIGYQNGDDILSSFDAEVPLADNSKYMYFYLDANTAIQWGNHTLGNDSGVTLLALDLEDPSLVAYSGAFGAFNDYVSSIGFGFSMNGLLDMPPSITWSNDSITSLSDQHGEFWVHGAGSIPVYKALSLTVSGDIMVDLADPDDLDPDAVIDLMENAWSGIDGWMLNGELGLSIGAGFWSFDIPAMNGTFQSDEATGWADLAVTVDSGTISIIPGLLDIEVPATVNYAATFYDGILKSYHYKGDFEMFNLSGNGEFLMQNDAVTFNGSMTTFGQTFAVTGTGSPTGYSLAGSRSGVIDMGILGGVMINVTLSISSANGLRVIPTFAYCMPNWLGSQCMTTDGEVVEQETVMACVNLPLVGQQCVEM